MTAPAKQVRPRVAVIEWVVMLGVSAVLIGLTWFHLWPLGMNEVMGVATGGVTLWLVMREHWISWPIGLANCLYLAVLFFTARLYADMSLQLVSSLLVIYGWWNWFHGGAAHQEIIISRTTASEWMGTAVFVLLGTWAMTSYLATVNDAAPFWDGFTTALCLTATFLSCRKRLENWYFWIATAAIYIPLYCSRGLILLGLIYCVFLSMDVYGYYIWKKKLRHLEALESQPARSFENSASTISGDAIPARE